MTAGDYLAGAALMLLGVLTLIAVGVTAVYVAVFLVRLKWGVGDLKEMVDESGDRLDSMEGRLSILEDEVDGYVAADDDPLDDDDDADYWKRSRNGGG